MPNGGTYCELITLHFEYGPQVLSISYIGGNTRLRDKLDRDLPMGNHGNAGATNEETVDAADKILATFGIKRLE